MGDGGSSLYPVDGEAMIFFTLRAIRVGLHLARSLDRKDKFCHAVKTTDGVACVCGFDGRLFRRKKNEENQVR